MRTLTDHGLAVVRGRLLARLGRLIDTAPAPPFGNRKIYGWNRTFIGAQTQQILFIGYPHGTSATRRPRRPLHDACSEPPGRLSRRPSKLRHGRITH